MRWSLAADLRAALGREARMAAGRFTKDRTVTGYEALYTAAITRRTRRLLRAS